MIMRALQNMSIRTKLMLVAMLTSCGALLLAAGAFAVHDWLTFREDALRHSVFRAELVAQSSTAALEFSDRKTADDVLSLIKSDPNVIAAVIYDARGKVFASHVRADRRKSFHVPSPQEDGHLLEGGTVSVFRQVTQDQRRVGTVYFQSGLEELNSRLRRYAVIVSAVLLAAIGVALLLCARLQSLISKPIVDLAATARRVAEEKNYALRVPKSGEDEVGRLVDGFNEMLAQIQLRDAALHQAQNELERRVEERTGELQAANGQLGSEIDERKAVEHALRESQEMVLRQERLAAVGQLAAGVAHDFNNIMTIIQGHTELLLLPHRSAAAASGSLRQISAAAARAAHLTQQLLAFSRRQVIRLAPVDLTVIANNTAGLLLRTLGENISLQVASRPGLPLVRADAGQIEQVLMNLVLNARDAMPHGGELKITFAPVRLSPEEVSRHAEARPGGFVCLSVRDTGCGMDEPTMRRIFEPFFTTKDVGKGTGLGLATAYGIARQHQGWIEVESTLGQGSEFRVYLPLHEVHESPAVPVVSREISAARW